MINETILRKIAKKEGVKFEELKREFALGHIVIPYNKNRPKKIEPLAIGKGLSTKINCNIGTSPEDADLEKELKKLEVAIKYGTDTIMDLSVGGDIKEIRKAIIDASTVPVGTVPIYEAQVWAKTHKKSFVELTPKEIFRVIEDHLKDGVDFITVHCGITKANLERTKAARRLTRVVSRGGSMIIEWMSYNKKENPLYEHYDELLELAKEYNVTLSLGDGLRPGSIHDASDEPQMLELLTIGELVTRARAAGVQVMVEGPGHIPINQIEANIRLEKLICSEAPFYVLGPLVTDIACGYDHITAAIGGALASYYGADFLCYVTPSEHLGLPTIEDVRVGVIASKIAAHAGDIARGLKKAQLRDYKISKARAELNWEQMIKLAIDPNRAREIFNARPIQKNGTCTMCGEFCALKKSKEILD
ncbi:MAG: phosphomethylpyrimidine synthase ThiC [candidate division WOR-3 bacterium]|nr:phosphomethylpyrimidine synthase ThiC [candidate division WOR-3 bacterium]